MAGRYIADVYQGSEREDNGTGKIGVEIIEGGRNLDWREKYLNKVTCIDCLEGMKELPDKSADLIWTDPVYNVGKDYGIYKDNLTDIEYLSWMELVILEMKRISQSIAMLIPHKYSLAFWNMLGPEYKQIILSWSPEGAIKWGFVGQDSFILTNAVPIKRCKNVWHNCQMLGLGWFFREDTYGHPGYTSEDITGRVIACFSKLDDLILDPFLGTGTTGVVAERLGRQWIGFDLSSKYCKEIAEPRIAKARKQLKLNIN